MARSLVISIAVLMVLATILNVLALRRPRDSGGVAADTYGVRGHGQRAVFELLQSLGIETSREARPPGGGAPIGATVALLSPSPLFVGLEPSYLMSLSRWVESGGRVVVAPPTRATVDRFEDSGDRDTVPRGELFPSLGLPGVTVTDGAAGGADSSGRLRQETVAKVYRLSDGQSQRELRLELPAGTAIELIPGDRPWKALLQLASADGAEGLLAASFPRGKGEVVVVADPDLFANGLVGRGDNSIAAVRLLAPDGKTVVFDEHYHGLSVRGNALYLLTRPEFATITVACLIASGLAAWRWGTALGPPVTAPPKPRRDLREYLAAMARLLLRGRDGKRLLLTELQRGVQEELGRRLGLSALTPSAESIAGSLARRERRRAEEFTAAMDAIDLRLAQPIRLSASETTQLMQGASRCL